MPRKGAVPKRDVLPDPVYGNKTVTRFINKVMLDGKKGVAEKIVYGAFDICHSKLNKEPIEIFEQALNNVMPVLEVRARRVGGANYQVPVEVRADRRLTLGIRWMVNYARQRKAILYYDPNFRKAHAHEAIRLAPTLLENFEYADIVRGSDEDFLNIFGETDSEKVYTDHIRFYCDRFITTHGAGGVNLYHGDRHRHFDSPAIRPVSTIGAGDNFNAGILYGLLKYNVRHRDLVTLPQETWANIIRCGIDLATEVCHSYDNYISKEFATSYRQ